MKTLIFIFLMISGLSFAQQIDFNSINSNNIQLLFENQKSAPKNISGSVTDIRQFGNYNSAEVYTKSKDNDLLLTQTGNFNATVINNQNAETSLKSEINVEGSNNYIDITGSNSISENIKLNFSTNDKMIFMRNY